MYASYFGLKDNPFSITPDPSYLYMSSHHQEALAHLLYGTGENGGFVQLTGEVGTGKTTLIRTLLEQNIEHLDVALCLNPKLTVNEFVASICDELHVEYAKNSTTLKPLIDALNKHLLKTHAEGRRTVLIIDEAQNLSYEVLEQVRLLTNLETHKHKLLRIILVGQPELQRLLERQDLRQLAQRITARYHLKPLSRKETFAYIKHRLKIAGGRGDIFHRRALKTVYRLSHGVPRIVNILCDRALLGTYVKGLDRVDATTLRRAAREALHRPRPGNAWQWWIAPASVCVLAAAVVAGLRWQHSAATLAPVAAQQAGATAGGPPVTEPEEQSELESLPIQPMATTASLDYPDASTPLLEQTSFQEAATVGANSPAKPASEQLPLDRLQTWLSDSGTSDDAANRLLGLWGKELAIAAGQSLCKEISPLGLRCLKGQGNWEDLRRYNHPAILYLDSDGSLHPVVLQALDGDMATLAIEDVPISVSVDSLSPLWNGDYLMLWRLQTSHHIIGPGSRGESIRWLQNRLALAEGRPQTSSSNSQFNDALRAKVRRFQSSQNLETDGIVGAQTMVLLNNLAPEPNTPLLADVPGREVP